MIWKWPLITDTHLSNHTIPGSIDFLPMLAIGDQVKVIGELHRFGNFLKDVNTEALAAFFDVTWLLICFIPKQLKKQNKIKTSLYIRSKILPFAITTYIRPKRGNKSDHRAAILSLTHCSKPDFLTIFNAPLKYNIH